MYLHSGMVALTWQYDSFSLNKNPIPQTPRERVCAWYCKPGQKMITLEIIGPRVHCVRLYSKGWCLCSHVCVALTSVRETCPHHSGGRLMQKSISDQNAKYCVSAQQWVNRIYYYISWHVRLREHLGRVGRKTATAAGKKEDCEMQRSGHK